MKLSVAGELDRELRNVAARFGVKPQTAARAAMRRGLRGLEIEDVEAEADPRVASDRQRRRAAREALDGLAR